MGEEENKKRKKVNVQQENADSEAENDHDAENSDDDEPDDIVQVDFDFFDPQPIDLQGTKSLLRQTFSDTEDIDLSELAELIISQPIVGSTVKVVGQTDPFAIFTVINLQEHKEKSCIEQLTKYLLDKSAKQNDKFEQLKTILSSKTNHVGYVVSERLINMPPQIAPPLFKMLLEEIGWAIEENEPFNFEYYLFISKTYTENEPEFDGDVSDSERAPLVTGKRKKKRKKVTSLTPSTLYFQAEDETIEKHAMFVCDFKLAVNPDSATADSKRIFQNFGIETGRRIMIVSRNEMKKLAAQLEVILK